MPSRRNIFNGTDWVNGSSTITPVAVTRQASEWPFAAESIWNISLGANAVYQSAGDTQTAALLAESPAFNSASWSVNYVVATPSDPLCTVTQTDNNTTYSYRIPTGFAPTGGSDGWCTVLQPSGALIDFYRLEKTGSTAYTCLYSPLSNDVYGYGEGPGRRASFVPLLAGLITPADIAYGEIRHMLASSGPANMLKKLPVDGIGPAGDGRVVKPTGNGTGQGWVWPAWGADNAANSDYSGPVAMGSVFAIPPSVDITSLGITTPGGLMVARALQDYGMCILATATTVPLMADPDCDATTITHMSAAWRNTLFPLLRRVQNNYPTGVTTTNKVPTSTNGILGGGARRKALAPPFGGP